MPSFPCEALFCKTFPFWNQLSPQQQEQLCRSTTYTAYAKGDVIHGGDSECTGAIVVSSGCIRAYLLSDEGREITLYRLYPGEVCMLSASCVLNSITFDVVVDAQQDSQCYILNGNAFAQLANRNLHVKNFALETAVSRFSDVMWVMQQILFMSFDRRLAIFLWDEQAKTGSSTLNLTHEQIAKYMGSAREVVSRMLKYFSTEGLVTLSRGGIHIVNKEKLRALALGMEK